METTLSRIRQMEEHLDAAEEALGTLEAALEGYAAVRPGLEALTRYYESPQWMADYDADSAGLLPPGLKRGVLSQDAVYDLLAQHTKLLNTMKEIIAHEKDL